MPTICFFYGIAIRMYFRDHAPAHFHAVYGEHEAFISIGTCVVKPAAGAYRGVAG
jgi:hypothetical protein